MNTALIVVDVQKDFCEGGSLAVDGGHGVAERIAQHLREHAGDYAQVVYTKDWHDAHNDNCGHFSDNPDFVDSWPAHCVARTRGADFSPGLAKYIATQNTIAVFRKGQGKASYSGFEGTLGISTVTLAEFLKDKGIEAVEVVGIAADYCVRATAVDAIKEGFQTRVLADLTVGIAKQGEEVAAEIAEMQAT